MWRYEYASGRRCYYIEAVDMADGHLLGDDSAGNLREARRLARERASA